ncbi:hypothetical protein KKA57_03655, partial [Patescibacteria group bacterium]|nr:hypothetical protein [Patescibacteria group bacterium]
NDLEKEIINTIYQLFINKNEIELILKPKDIREKMNDEIWYNFIDTNQKKDIRVGKIVKKFNLTTNKITSSEGVAYQFQKDKIEKIRKTVFKAEDNSPDSPLSENNQEATPISYEELPEEARQNDEPTPINEEIPF